MGAFIIICETCGDSTKVTEQDGFIVHSEEDVYLNSYQNGEVSIECSKCGAKIRGL